MFTPQKLNRFEDSFFPTMLYPRVVVAVWYYDELHKDSREHQHHL
jgi:hypothetical protein